MKTLDIKKYLISKGHELTNVSRREFDGLKRRWIEVYGSHRGKFDPSKHSDLYWEALSGEYCESVHEGKAQKAYRSLKPAQAFIVSDGSFSHKAAFRAEGPLPGLKMIKKYAHGELYVMSPDLSWVYIVTHEKYIGPYFSKAVWQEKKVEMLPPQISIYFERSSRIIGFDKTMLVVERIEKRINKKLKTSKGLISPVRWISLNCGIFPEEMNVFGQSIEFDKRRGALRFRLKVDFLKFKAANTREKAEMIISLFVKGLLHPMVKKMRIKKFDAHAVSRLIDGVIKSRN